MNIFYNDFVLSIDTYRFFIYNLIINYIRKFSFWFRYRYRIPNCSTAFSRQYNNFQYYTGNSLSQIMKIQFKHTFRAYMLAQNKSKYLERKLSKWVKSIEHSLKIPFLGSGDHKINIAKKSQLTFFTNTILCLHYIRLVCEKVKTEGKIRISHWLNCCKQCTLIWYRVIVTANRLTYVEVNSNHNTRCN